MRFASSLVFVALLLAPSVALAGGCPTCTTSDECGFDGGLGYCVEWSRDFGCGAQRIACCPGQGCAVAMGRPSCEASGDCRVIDEDAGVPAVDAGPVGDAGSNDDAGAGSDAGAGADGGSTGTDAGGAGTDGGAVSMDGGPGPVDGGCSCRVGRSRPAGPALLAFAAVGLALLGARRRR